MRIRTATYQDLDDIYAIEQESFLPNEAASYPALSERLRIFPDQFWVLEENNSTLNKKDHILLGFIGGIVTGHDRILDEMFTHASLHDPSAKWLSVLGLAIAPAYRQKGLAGKLLNQAAMQARAEARTGITLTCKQHLVSFYEHFGYKNAGISTSQHGGARWHDMVLFL